MKLVRAACWAVVFGLAGCFRHAPPPAPPALMASPHYVLGAPYRRDGTWFYPQEQYGLDRTGIAAILPPHAGLTADGELTDPAVATGAMQTVQLPAIVRVTNLENGRQILLRVNDRGPDTPARLIGLSPRAAVLLAMTGPARVRVEMDAQMSHRLVDQLGGGPKLAIATAPADSVLAAALPPPGSSGAAGPARAISGLPARLDGPAVPDRLPEMIYQVGADPGRIFIEAGSFGRFDYANMLAARLAGLGADVLRSTDGRQTSYTVRAGPFRDIAAADAALASALRAGAVDARIVVLP